MNADRIRLRSGVFATLVLFGATLFISLTQGQVAPETPMGTPNPDAIIEEAIKKILDDRDLAGARPLFQQARALAPMAPKLNLLEGLLLMNEQRYTEALIKLETYNTSDVARNDYRGFAMVGAIYMQSRMHQQAKSALEKAFEYAPHPSETPDDPIRARIGLDLAAVHAALKLNKRAATIAQQAGADAPKDPDIQLRLAEIANSAGDAKLATDAARLAITLLKEKIRDDPFNLDAHVKLRRAYQIFSLIYQLNIKADPDNGEHYAGYAQMIINSSAIDKRISMLSALELFVQAIEKNAKSPGWQVNAARLEHELGGVGRAKERLDALLAKDPNFMPAVRMKEAIDSGRRAAPLEEEDENDPLPE